MIEERFDYAKTPSALKGGSSGTQTVIVLVRYGGSEYVHQTTFRVRMLYADYTPIAYYRYNDNSGLYELITRNYNSAEDAPDSLYIAVRTDYWNEVGNTNAYIAESKATPYDSISDDCYKLLEEKYSVVGLYGDVEKDGYRLVKVTDITYATTASGGKFRSTSVTIDGVTCATNLIALNAAS